MTQYLSESDLLLRDCATWTCYAAFADITRNSDRSISYHNSGDPFGYLPGLFPYSSTGLNLGRVNEVDLDPGTKIKDGEPKNLTSLSTAQDARFSGFKRLLQFGVYSSRRPQVRYLLLDPGGRSATGGDGGSENLCPIHNLLICLANLTSGEDYPDQFLMIFNEVVIFEPPKEKFNGQLSILNVLAHCYPVTDGDGCPIGGLWQEYWVDNRGIPTDFTDPMNPIVPDQYASGKAYPAINMVGGMLG